MGSKPGLEVGGWGLGIEDWDWGLGIGDWGLGACEVFTSVNSSILIIPLIPMFWVISTALVLQGVIISFLGPTKVPCKAGSAIHSASPNSQFSFSISIAGSGFWCSTAKYLSMFLKKVSMYFS